MRDMDADDFQQAVRSHLNSTDYYARRAALDAQNAITQQRRGNKERAEQAMNDYERSESMCELADDDCNVLSQFVHWILGS